MADHIDPQQIFFLIDRYPRNLHGIEKFCHAPFDSQIRKYFLKLFFHSYSFAFFSLAPVDPARPLRADSSSLSGSFFNDLTFSNENDYADSAGNTKIRFLRLARSVDHAAHDGNLDIQRISLYQRLHLVCQSDQVNLGPSAGRTRYDLNAAFSKSQGL